MVQRTDALPRNCDPHPNPRIFVTDLIESWPCGAPHALMGAEVPRAMSLAVLAPLKSRPAVPPVVVPPAKVGGYVAVTVSVRADRQRLFQLLTVAEYMEAWLTAPGAERDGRLSITSDLESFRIDHFHARGIDFSITGLYRARRRSKLQFTWRKDTEAGSSTSLVLVRMYGDFERTI